MEILNLIILLLQDGSKAASGITGNYYADLAIAVGTMLGGREIVAMIFNRRKAKAETLNLQATAEATRHKTEADTETAQVSNVDKAAASIMAAAETVVRFSDDLSRCREERDRVKGEFHFMELESRQKDAALRRASDKISEQDAVIVELRKQLNKQNDGEK